MTAKEIDGRKIAEVLKKNISNKVEELKSIYKKIPNITTMLL